MDSKSIVKLILKYKVSVLIIVVLSGLSAAVFSSNLFITPLYRSTVILYPTSTYSTSKAVFNTNKLIYIDPLKIGEEFQTEQMLQILNSNLIRDKIIEKYDLENHYSLNNVKKFKQSKLYSEFKSKIKFQRTEYNAVKIVVLDSDPLFAANIANDISNYFDTTMNNIQKDLAIKTLNIIENEYNTIQNEILLLEDSIKSFAKYGIYDYDIQMNTLNNQMSVELGANNKQGIKNLEEKIKSISEYGVKIKSINDNLKELRSRQSLIKLKYDEALIDVNEELPHKFVVVSAFAAEKPTYPVKWVIFLITIISTFFALILSLTIIEYFSDQKKK